MARGVNKVIIVGNLGADPEVRFMPNGGAIANLRVATTDAWKDKQSGEMQEKTEWHKVVLFNKLGQIAGDYLKKGSKVYLEGSLRTTKWQDQSGNDRYTTEIVANNMQMLDSRGSSGGYSAPSSNQQPMQNENSFAPTPSASAPATAENIDDDDIPF